MLLNNCELIPAVIQSVKDPKKLGRIKCVIPGIIDNSTMSEENMPWCYPFGMNAYQSFSKCIPGQKVWVLINKSNYNEYWYLPFFEYNEISKEYLEGVYDNDNPEILVSRSLGDNSALSTYDDKAGFSERIGDNHIDLHPDGHISLVGGEGEVDIDGGSIKIGKIGGEDTEAVRYKELKEMLTGIYEAFVEMGAVSSSPFLSPLAKVSQKALEKLTPNKINQAKSDIIKIS